MTSQEALERVVTNAHKSLCRQPGCEECDGAREALEQLRADARALWSVRVLDAWAEIEKRNVPAPGYDRRQSKPWSLFVPVQTERRVFYGYDPDAARHAAALAVFPTLDADVRADLGECP